MRKATIKEERRRRRHRKYKMYVFLVTVAILAAAALVVVKVFTVDKVLVQGNVLYEEELIEQTVLSDQYSWNSLYVYLKYKFMKQKEVPFIDTMEVTLEDPHTLKVTVYEKGIMGYFYVESSDMNVYFDKDGFAVEISESKIMDVPEIKGIVCDDVVLYEKLPLDENALREMLTLTQTLKRNKLVPDAIVYGQTYSPVLVYKNVRIYVGSKELLTKKVERIEKILPSIRDMSGVLHLENWNEEINNIVFDTDEA